MTEEKLEKDMVLSDDLFEFVKVDEKASEKIATPEYSYWGSVFRKFFSSKVAVFMLVVLIAVLAFAFIPVSYTHLTLPTTRLVCRYRWSPYH